MSRKFSMFSMFTMVTSVGMVNDCQSVIKRNVPSCGLITSCLPLRLHVIGSYEFTGKPGQERDVTSFELPVSAACSDLVASASCISVILSILENLVKVVDIFVYTRKNRYLCGKFRV